MRTINVFVMATALTIAVVSLWIDEAGADPESHACRLGTCRKDQLLAALGNRQQSGQDADIKTVKRLTSVSPADAYAWALLAEYTNRTGSAADARVSLDRAVDLAPATAPILMRRLNLCVEKRDADCALRDGKVILRLSDAYDGVIFMYYAALGVRVENALQAGLPETGRALRCYAMQLAKNANSTSDVMVAWERLRTLGQADEATMCGITQHLVSRGEPASAWRVWREYIPGKNIKTDSSNRLTDSEFKRKPTSSPFDWSIRPQPGVSFQRQNGLQVRFAGKTNLAFLNVSQMSYVRPVQHRLVLDVSHEGITTNQGPFLRLVDAEDPGRLNVKTEMLLGSSPQRRIELNFVVPAGTRLVRVQLERTPSEKFDNKIAGTLHLHRITLTEAAPRQ